jgi:acetyl/propionyl-CoA carboxylase alpha subunit
VQHSRRHQKVVEIAPAPDIGDAVRSALCRTALDFACAVRISGLATFEFLLDLDNPGSFYFIEANPRLQVEHGVTEQITGLDLVRLQLDLALGRTLQELNITQATVGAPDGTAIEARVTTAPSRTGDNHITRFDMPTGDGIRVDTHGSVGMAVSDGYDPLLAKIIAHADSYSGAVETLREALDRTDIVGPATDLDLLRWILRTDEVRNASMSTSLVDRHLAALEPVAKRADGEAENRAHNAASVFEIDDVIDPAQTRSWIAATVREHEAHPPRPGGQRRIDTW